MTESRAFEGRVAVVTGGASGIGAATVARLAAGGATVHVADLPEVDVSDEGSVVGFFDRLGPLDLAVNCAGVSGTFGALVDLDLTDWSRTLAVNLTGVFLCLREELRHMRAGAVVNVASAAGLRGFAQLPDYVASKHGVIGLTRAAALEHARSGIRINAVAPGGVHTPMLERFVGGDPAGLEAMGRNAPMGRLATPEEIAAAIVWLCSEDAAFVTGAVLSADGGVSAA